MSLLEITELAHSFGGNFLFKDADFTLNKGEHIGIVGQNGAGKSTFIKICTGQLIPDSGRVVWQANTRIGYLGQIEQMSGGQRAKVILAKLLLEKPDVLLLDEPTIMKMSGMLTKGFHGL